MEVDRELERALMSFSFSAADYSVIASGDGVLAKKLQQWLLFHLSQLITLANLEIIVAPHRAEFLVKTKTLINTNRRLTNDVLGSNFTLSLIFPSRSATAFVNLVICSNSNMELV